MPFFWQRDDLDYDHIRTLYVFDINDVYGIILIWGLFKKNNNESNLDMTLPTDQVKIHTTDGPDPISFPELHSTLREVIVPGDLKN